jgi:hypothetical protein
MKGYEIEQFFVSDLIGISHRMKINLIARIAPDCCTGFLKIVGCGYKLHLAMADYS